MYAVRQHVENNYLIRERDRRRMAELLVLVLAAVPLMAVLFAVIWANLKTYEVGYQIGNLEKQRESLLAKRRQLLIERAEASSLIRVETIARGSLGLLPPRPEQLILIRDLSRVDTPSRPPAPLPTRPELIGPPAPESTEEGF